MPTSKKPSPSPLDGARAAFEPLSTPDKTAFVLEATFETIGQALAETGKTFSDAIQQMSTGDWFRPPSAPPPPPPEPPTTPPAVPPRPRRAS